MLSSGGGYLRTNGRFAPIAAIPPAATASRTLRQSLMPICASRCHQQGFFLAGKLAFRSRTRILAQRPFQIAFHEAPLGPVHGGTAHRHRARNLFIAAAGIGRQQYLGALEFAGGSFALAQSRRVHNVRLGSIRPDNVHSSRPPCWSTGRIDKLIENQAPLAASALKVSPKSKA